MINPLLPVKSAKDNTERIFVNPIRINISPPHVLSVHFERRIKSIIEGFIFAQP